MNDNIMEILLDIQKHNKIVDARFDQIDKRFEQIDKKFEQIDKKFEQIDQKFEQIDQKFEQIDARLDDIQYGVSEVIKGITNYFGNEIGINKNEKFKSMSHMQILEDHEDRISLLESKRIANQ